jgi:hypothetical protein
VAPRTPALAISSTRSRLVKSSRSYPQSLARPTSHPASSALRFRHFSRPASSCWKASAVASSAAATSTTRRYGVVVEELAVEVMAQLPDDRARQEVMALVEVARMDPRAWPDVRDPGSVEEIREAFGRRCWIQYMPHAGAIEVRDIGWAG